MRHLAMTGMDTASMILRIRSGSDMRATPPWARISAGTRSSAITAHAPASSAMRACSGVTTSMMTPPLSIWASPFLVAQVEVSAVISGYPILGCGGLGSVHQRDSASRHAHQLYADLAVPQPSGPDREPRRG